MPSLASTGACRAVRPALQLGDAAAGGGDRCTRSFRHDVSGNVRVQRNRAVVALRDLGWSVMPTCLLGNRDRFRPRSLFDSVGHPVGQGNTCDCMSRLSKSSPAAQLTDQSNDLQPRGGLPVAGAASTKRHSALRRPAPESASFYFRATAVWGLATRSRRRSPVIGAARRADLVARGSR